MIEIFIVIFCISIVIFCISMLIGLFIIISVSTVIVTKCICSYLIPILKPYFLPGEYGDVISEYSLFIIVLLTVGGILGLNAFLKIFKKLKKYGNDKNI